MRKSSKIISAAAIAVLAAAGGTAFTGTGVTNSAGSTQYVGGTVSQTVNGATLTNVSYTFVDPLAKTHVATIVLTLDGANARTVDVKANSDEAVDLSFGGTIVAGVGIGSGTVTQTGTTTAGTVTFAPTIAGGGILGYPSLNSLDITVN